MSGTCRRCCWRALFGHRNYASGQTLCLRRQTLERIGGFAVMANHLADDYRLGELIRGLGLRIVLSPTVVMAEHHEPNLDSPDATRTALDAHHPRVAAAQFSRHVSELQLPMACCGLLLSAADSAMWTLAWSLFGTAVGARLALHFAHRLRNRRPLFSDLWLVPPRDLLLCWIWLQSFFTARVTWRGGEFDVDADGIMHRPY